MHAAAMGRVGARFQSALNLRVFLGVLEASALRIADRTRESALQHLEAIRTFFTSPVMLTLFDLPWTPVFLVAIFIFHPLLGWLAVAGGALLIAVSIVNQLVTHTRVAQAQGFPSPKAASPSRPRTAVS